MPGVRKSAQPTTMEGKSSEQFLSEAERVRNTLAKKEDKAIGYLRIIVFLLLVGVAASVATFIYSYVDTEQKENFDNDFQAHAFKIIESFEKTMSGKVEAMDALAMQYTAYAKETGATWPNVSLPNFEWKANNARILSSVMLINEHIIVSNEDRAGFEAFYAEHVIPEFIAQMEVENEQRSYQDEQMGYNATEPLDTSGEDPLWGGIVAMTPQGTFGPAPPETGPHLVWTKTNPINHRLLQGAFGIDALSMPGGRFDAQRVMDSKKAIFAAAQNYEGDLTTVAGYLKSVLRAGQYRHNEEELYLDPTSLFYYPIFDEFGDHDNRNVVGILISTMYWKYYFKDILPPNARGIVCVLENSANQTLTYLVNGPDSVFVGGGDLHDTKYTSMKVSERLSEFIVGRTSPETKSFSSTTIDFDYLDWTITVYPSLETEDQYLNNDPLIFTLVVVSVFCFTSFVFVGYDRLVARRQRIVMDRAIASGTIVAELYPEQVRDQIYQEGNKDKKTSMAKEEKEVRQIAQKYEATTIMFADLAGFTKWSSTREPHHVFELLEAIYKEFDLIAQRRGVFKVETVGDCYVAVTGLPNPQEKHAVIMARFAYDCLNKVNEVVHSLVDTLGSETADLQLRVGLHSGPVTGGVLRGQKSRFSLFGDSMNTASRMESNGEKGRIQVSQETAEELKLFGKDAWLTPRNGKISAKGKGDLQTYWLLPVSDDATTLRSSAFYSSTHEEEDDDASDVIPGDHLEV